MRDARAQKIWLEKQQWYIDASERGSLYSELFEMYEGKDRGRQLYIEQMIEGKKPSFGYVVLANLMARNYVNTVITTNFDDLIYNACVTYTEIRPVVYAYGTMISDLRVTNSRPKILKLHGDYLYSRLKNSKGELAHQDPNMSRHVPILLNEYGLIVVGYSGCDKSVMDMLRRFPSNNDLYWCGRANSPMPEPVRELLLETDGLYVEIDSFDQMMDNIRSVVAFDVPKMLGSLEARQDHIVEQIKSFPRSLSGLGSLLREIYEYRQQDAAERLRRNRKEEAFLHYVNAVQAHQSSDFASAEREYRASLALNPDDIDTHVELALVLTQEGNYAESEKELKEARLTATGDTLSRIVYRLAYLYMIQSRYADALTELTESIRLAPKDADAFNAAGVAHLMLRQFEEAASFLRKAAELDPATYYAPFNLACTLIVKGENSEAASWWVKAESLWQNIDHIDPYNYALIQLCLGKKDEGIQLMRAAIASGQPGLSSLELESVSILGSAPAPPDGILELRLMLEAAITNERQHSAPAGA